MTAFQKEIAASGKKIELEQQIAVLEKSKGNRLEPLRNWILEANQAEKVVSKDNWLEMKSLLQKVGSNRLLRAQTLTVSFKKPFDSLAETTLAVRSTTDVFSQSSKWWWSLKLCVAGRRVNLLLASSGCAPN